MKLTTQEPFSNDGQKMWLHMNKDLILSNQSEAILQYMQRFNLSHIKRVTQLIGYWNAYFMTKDGTPAVDYVISEDDIIPAWDAPRLVSPCRPIEHIPGTTKVIVTYPSKV